MPQAAPASKPVITLIGDSTLDNRVWVSASLKNKRLKAKPGHGLNVGDSAKRIQHSHRHLPQFFKPALSIAENLQDLLPEFEIQNYSNVGFTSQDILQGAYSDKAVGEGVFDLYPHELRQPLVEAEQHLQQSSAVVISVGGNDIREFISQLAAITDPVERTVYIGNHFEQLMRGITDNYLKIIHHVRSKNAQAKIVIATQYYPGYLQNEQQTYQYLAEIGQAMGYGVNPGDGLDAAHAIMQKIYARVLRLMPQDNVVVADIASSLNPFDNQNFVLQIEPSQKGGTRIAMMLKHILSDQQQQVAYQFEKAFFAETENAAFTPGPVVTSTALSAWQVKHPHHFTDENCKKLLDEIGLIQRNHYAVDSPIALALKAAHVEAHRLLTEVKSDYEIGVLRDGLLLTLKVARTPNDIDGVAKLKAYADLHAQGKPSGKKKFAAVLLAVLGAIALTLGIVFSVLTLGLSGIGIVGGSLALGAASAILFYKNNYDSLALKLSNLSDAADQHRKSTPGPNFIPLLSSH